MPTILCRLLATLALLLVAAAVTAAEWPAARLQVEMGSGNPTQDALVLAPNASGQLLLTLPAAGLPLAEHPRLQLQFDGPAAPQLFVIWRVRGNSELYQHKVVTRGARHLQVDMAGVPGWNGTATLVQIGLRLPPGRSVVLQAVSLDAPGIADGVAAAWQSWRHFQPWRPVDINLHTGTRDFGAGPYPLPIFAAATALALAAYLLVARRRARWAPVGVILFAGWLALDTLWQARLWQQLAQTRAQFGGLDGEARLLASDDRAMVALAGAAGAAIPDPQARVFVASRSDRNGMLAAYYLAPRNSYWNRHGAELPAAKHLRPGDHILIVRPSGLRYQPEPGTLATTGGELRVAERYRGSEGLLLEVLP